jgi:hypothetical protein
MTFVCGPVASGKTFTIRQWLRTDNRHVIFDSTGEYHDETNEQVWANPQELYRRMKENPFYYRLVYVPGRDRAEDFHHCLNVVWWRTEQARLLVCDEIADLCPVTGISEDMEMLLRFARKVKLGFLAASQRIADVSKLLTSGCRMVVLYQTNEIRDLQAIEDRWGCADMVQKLRPLLYDDTSEQTQQVPQCVVIEKGKRPYVYDFQSEGRVTEKEDVPEQDSSTGSLEESASADRGEENADENAHATASERDPASSTATNGDNSE